jgi:branched-chain amino acid transport system ATP-binding protein
MNSGLRREITDQAEGAPDDGDTRAADDETGPASGSRRQPVDDPAAFRRLFDYDVESGASVLVVEDLVVQYGGVLALDQVHMQVGSHEIVAVVGANGAGKSTLLNAISGLARDRSRGSIAVNSVQVLGRAPVHIARAGVGRTFQDPLLIDTETVLQNVMLGQHQRLRYGVFDQLLRGRKVNRLENDALQRCGNLLEFFGLHEVEDMVAGQLPYGTRKLIDIVRAVASGPRLLLLDEPTSGLDLDEQADFARALRELHAKSQVSILIVEHHMDVVRALADHVVGLESGKVIVTGKTKDVLDSQEFRAALVGARKAEKADGNDLSQTQLGKDAPWRSS